LTAVSIPGEANTLTAEETQAAAARAGITAGTAESVLSAVRASAAADPGSRILICGSLYLAGTVLRDNG
ncbi:MAG: bifunctional folylpolyglutamate synthase/dihydrofolate synthase, partial [Paracoccaceae bacterium]